MDTAVRPAVRQGALTAALCLCAVLVVAMVAAINLALPKLAASGLRPSATALVWIVDSYVVVFACLLVPAGAVADRLGRKGVLLTGLAVFAAGALLSGCAGSVPVLLAGRVLSGLGAACVLPNTLALLVGAAEPASKPRLIGIWASATGLAGVVGNVGGGALLQAGSWRTLFLTVVPLAAAAFGLVAAVVPKMPAHPRPVELVSAVLFTAGTVALLLGVTLGPEYGWLGAPVLACFAAAVLLLAGWAGYELRVTHPLLDPRLFRAPALRANSVAMAGVFVGMFGLFYVNGQFLQYAKGFGPLAAGLGLLPMVGAMIVVPRAAVALAARVGARVVVLAGLAVLACGLLVTSTVDAGTPYVWYAALTVVVATGTSLVMPVASAGIMASLPAERAGLGSGLQSMTRELGSALGVAVVGTVLGTGEFGGAMSLALLVLAGVVVLAGVATALDFPRARAGAGRG